MEEEIYILPRTTQSGELQQRTIRLTCRATRPAVDSFKPEMASIEMSLVNWEHPWPFWLPLQIGAAVSKVASRDCCARLEGAVSLPRQGGQSGQNY